MKVLSILLLAALFSVQSFSQDISLLNPLPTTKEEFVKSEPSVISLVEWLETTPIGQDTEKRKEMNALFLAWLTNSPTVTVQLDAKITPMSKKNPDLLAVFLGGWTKYSLQNGYSKDLVKCNLAGIKSVISLYKLKGDIKKDKEIEKLVELDAKNELEAWLMAKLGKN
jgi:hypothetical protein